MLVIESYSWKKRNFLANELGKMAYVPRIVRMATKGPSIQTKRNRKKEGVRRMENIQRTRKEKEYSRGEIPVMDWCV